MSVLELQPGDVFEGYTVRRALGRGGMGAVYLVHHPRFDADMALKVMTIQAATEAELETHRARFTREARTLVRLRHQSIIRVHDFAEHVDEDGVCPYILMEFFAGQDGLKWIKQNPSLDRVRHVAIQLADALACAHDAGVLHRDLKYGNILVNPKDEAVLIDFGIAKSEADETVTQTGLSVGTLSHMAPEYLDASKKGLSPEHTVKTDLWAFGCLLYFLTTHRNAFQSGGKGAAVLIRMIEQEPHPPVRSVRTDASEEWASLIDDLLQKNSDARVPTARELRRRLEAITTTTDAGAPPFVPPIPPGAQRTPSPERSTVAPSQPQQTQPPTAQARRMKVVSSDDPFQVAKAEPVSISKPSLELPPLDGITGIHSAQASVAKGAAALPPLDAVTGIHTAAPPSTAPPPMAVLPKDPTPPPAAPVSPPRDPTAVPLQASAAAPLSAAVPDGLGTFIAALQPDQAQRVAPASSEPEPAPGAASQVAAPQLSEEHATPRTGAFSLAAGSAPENESIVQPLPSFAPPTPKATTKQSALRALALPIGAVAVIVVAGLSAFTLLGNQAQRKSPLPPPGEVAHDEVLKKAEERANRELAALERAQSATTTVPVVPVPVPQQPVPMPPAVASAPEPSPPASQGRTTKTRNAAAAPAPALAPVDPITAKYGNRNFNTGSFGSSPSSTPGTGAPGGAAPAAAVAGVKIPVRVDTEIASTTSPVIATVTKETRVGNLTLPVGTQIHGTSGLAQGTRVAVNFRFAIVGGKNVPLVGQALAADGRAGLPGVRSMGNGSDVASRALGSAVAATADAAAAVAGDNPFGAAVRGAGGTAAGKADRLNSDEDIVVVKRGARFVVYVGGQ